MAKAYLLLRISHSVLLVLAAAQHRHTVPAEASLCRLSNAVTPENGMLVFARMCCERLPVRVYLPFLLNFAVNAQGV